MPSLAKSPCLSDIVFFFCSVRWSVNFPARLPQPSLLKKNPSESESDSPDSANHHKMLERGAIFLWHDIFILISKSITSWRPDWSRRPLRLRPPVEASSCKPAPRMWFASITCYCIHTMMIKLACSEVDLQMNGLGCTLEDELPSSDITPGRSHNRPRRSAGVRLCSGNLCTLVCVRRYIPVNERHYFLESILSEINRDVLQRPSRWRM